MDTPPDSLTSALFGDENSPEEAIVIISDPPETTPTESATISTGRAGEHSSRGLILVFDPDADISPDLTEFEIATLADTQLYRTPHPELATALFLSYAEITGIDERTVTGLFDEPASTEALAAYREWNNALTPRDRRLRLLDLIESMSENPVYETVLEIGEFHSTADALTQAEHNTITDAIDTLGCENIHPQQCYQNALNLYTLLVDTTEHDITYAEGAALPPQAARPVTHAWLSINGHPIEVTFPWEKLNPENTVYFGTRISDADVQTALDTAANSDGRIPSPLLLSAEDRQRLRDDPGSPSPV